MSKQAERCKKRATDCEAAAQKLTDKEIRSLSWTLRINGGSWQSKRKC